MPKWHYSCDAQVFGPFTDAEILLLVRTGRLRPEDPVTSDAMDGWYPAQDISGLDFAAPPADSSTLLEFADAARKAAAEAQQPVDPRIVRLEPKHSHALAPKRMGHADLPDLPLPPFPAAAAPEVRTATNAAIAERVTRGPPSDTPGTPPDAPPPAPAPGEPVASPEAGPGNRIPRIEYGGLLEVPETPLPPGLAGWWQAFLNTRHFPVLAALAVAAAGLMLPLLLLRGCGERSPAPTGPTRTTADMKNQLETGGRVFGRYLAAKYPRHRALVVLPPKESEPGSERRAAALVRGLREGFADAIMIVATDCPRIPAAVESQMSRQAAGRGRRSTWTPPLQYWYSAAVLDALLEAHSECDLVVSLVGLPADTGRSRLWQRDPAKRPRLAVGAGPVSGLQALIDPAGIVTVLDHRPGLAADLPEAVRDAPEAFTRNFRLVTPENAGVMLRRQPRLFEE